MIVKFKTKTGYEFTGNVLFRGYYNVDKPESYEVNIGKSILWVPVTDCTEVA